MDEEKGLQFSMEDVVSALSEKLKQADINNAYMIAQMKAVQKENERLQGVIQELKNKDAE